MKQRTFNEYLKERFGCKVYKLSLNAGCTCPNRDGTKGTGGCIFCSGKGSGDFAPSGDTPIPEQIAFAKSLVANKGATKYIAYFGTYTSTYGNLDRLRQVFTQAIEPEDVVALSIATRPDCLGEGVLELLKELNEVKPVFVELGLQTVHESTARYIRRRFETTEYDRAVENLHALGIEVVTHLILGLPGESEEMILQSVEHVAKVGSDGIKLQLLHVLEGTDLHKDYLQGKVPVMSEDDYVALVKKCVLALPEDIIIHRLTGDGDKKILVAPLWSGNKRQVLNRLTKELKDI